MKKLDLKDKVSTLKTKIKNKRMSTIPRTQEVWQARDKASKSPTLHYYQCKRKRNILIWTLIMFGPILDTLSFLVYYLMTKKTSSYIGLLTSAAVLASYLAAYIPIILGNKIWVYTYKNTLITVYIGIIRCYLVIDEKLWDKKPKKSKTYMYGRLPDKQPIEVCKEGMTCKISMDIYQKSITPVI